MNAKLNIFVRVIKRRMAKGENLDDILNDYPRLSDEEKDQIKQALS